MTIRTSIPPSKRLLDLVITISGLVIISPILLVEAVLVRIFIGSPVFFRQLRPGYKNRQFYRQRRQGRVKSKTQGYRRNY